VQLVSPALVLATLLGSLIGLAFYFLFGGKGDRLATCWALGVAGFLIGHLAGSVYPLGSLLVGEVRILEGTLGSALALTAAHFYARQTASRK
jgi:hypothetical protein